VLDHVLAHPDGDLRTMTLAELAGVSSRQLTRLFQEHLHSPPAEAVRRVRLELAARLTSSSDLSVGQIARRCGFGSAESLRQAFVARYGVSPREMRRTHAQSLGGHQGRKLTDDVVAGSERGGDLPHRHFHRPPHFPHSGKDEPTPDTEGHRSCAYAPPPASPARPSR